MTESDIETVVRRWFEVFNEGTVDELLELCHPEIEMWNPPEFPVRDHYVGREGIRRWREEAWDVIDELRMEVEGVIEAPDGKLFVMMLRVRGVGAHTRIPIDETWASVSELRDGKLYRARGYVSRREALRAAGLRE